MRSIPRHQVGFTIVELLIVIVVIGILAAITIVAYNGMQQRANTAQITSTVDSWDKIIKMELALQPGGKLPETPGSGICLGSSSADFPQTTIFPADTCFEGETVDEDIYYSDSYFS